MHKAYLGLGGNIGDAKANILAALNSLSNHKAVRLINVSSFYETAPVGYEEQAWFVNVVAEIETTLPPYELLQLCNDIEHDLKRERLIRWGPRTIDIDILLYEGFESSEEKLMVPHPRMTERAFVMIPLMEIAPDISIKGVNIKAIVEKISDQEIRKQSND